ncbi:unknown [Clostridium sp. CAG:524]|nr:unknown [Clostridium sp. CAG:524]
MLVNKQLKIKEENFSNNRNFQDIILDYLIYTLNISNDNLHNLKNDANINMS